MSLHELFASAAARYPDRVAVVDAQGPVSYCELDRAASALARRLAGLGAGRGDRIIVWDDKSARSSPRCRRRCG